MYKQLLFLITILGFAQSVILAQTDKDISALTSEADLWYLSKNKITKQFPTFKWVKGTDENSYTYKANNLNLWGQAVYQIDLTLAEGIANNLRLTIVPQKEARTMEKKGFEAKASIWNKLLTEKLKTKGKRIASISYGSIKHNRLAWKDGETVIILSANQSDVADKLEVTFYEESRGLEELKLSGQQTKADKVALNSKKNEKAEIDSELTNEDFAPREIKKQIKDTIKEIEGRAPENGISKKVQEAVNLLNVYRFLSGVPYDVKADKKLVSASEEAATICAKKGKLSHDFGFSTDKCNLAMSSSNLTMERSVTQYINDAGANNRERRGHRRWCLNHKMGKTGFGIKDSFSAMYSLDQSARGIKDNYSYPGHGFYPIEYLHGNGWSYHLVDGSTPENCEIKVWKLKSFEEKPPNWSKDPVGKELIVDFKYVYRNTIVFEPSSDPITKKGSYLVRIKGSGLKEQYLVHLY